MKKAFLVSFTLMTRVVVDIKEGLLNPYDYSKIISAARENIIYNGIDDYLNGDTIDEIRLDEELPYPQEFDV